MNAAQFLEQSSAQFEQAAAEIDRLLAKPTEATWQATRTDNGWTTAQIVEHMSRTRWFYLPGAAEALSKAPPADESAEVQVGFLAKLILKGLAKRNTPTPSKLVVAESISSETALEHWAMLKESVRGELLLAKGKSLSKPRFKNPFVPIFKMSFADHLALQIEHLHYHTPQIQARAAVSADDNFR